MALPGKENLKLYRGDTRIWTSVFTELDANGEPVLDDDDNPVPIDLTGLTWLCQIRNDRARGDVVAEIDIDDTDAENGVIVRTLTAAEADALDPALESLSWDLQSTDGDGTVRTWLSGSVSVEGDVSDA